MSSPFVAEVKAFAGNFAPRGYATCQGQLLPISQNTALFSLLGTYYGGDGKSIFALPNLQGSATVQTGQGNGLQEWYQGQIEGSDQVTLLVSEIPMHNHAIQAVNANATTADPTNAILAKGAYGSGASGGAVAMYQTAAPNVQMNLQACAVAGSGLPHNNMMPYLTLTYIIALQGVFPPRP
jgi:microcystin-dependent protein